MHYRKYTIGTPSTDELRSFVRSFLDGQEFHEHALGASMLFLFETWYQGSNSYLLQCVGIAPHGDAHELLYFTSGTGYTMLSATLGQMPFITRSAADRLESLFENTVPTIDRFDHALRIMADSMGWRLETEHEDQAATGDVNDMERAWTEDGTRCPACGADTANMQEVCPSCGLTLG